MARSALNPLAGFFVTFKIVYMHRDYKFKIGQRVKTIDPDYPNSIEIIHGTVDDTFGGGICIIWDKSPDCRHAYDETDFLLIGLSRKRPRIGLERGV